MRFRIAALLVLCLASVQRAEAVCKVDEIKSLLDSGFTHEQVMELCGTPQGGEGGAPSLPPGEIGGETAVAPSDFSIGLIQPGLGDDGTWNKFVLNGAYVVQNKRDPAGYLIVPVTEPLAAGWGSLSVEVRFHHEVPEDGFFGPALIYTSDPEAKVLSIFNFLADGTVNLYKFDDGEMTLVKSKQNPEFLPGREFKSYGLVEGKDKIELVVDGKSTGIEAPYDGTKPSIVGLAAFGIGSYEFRNFVRNEK